jgi:putative ABC transport system substrate-binding protein
MMKKSMPFAIMLVILAVVLFFYTNTHHTEPPQNPSRITCLHYTNVDLTAISGFQAGMQEHGFAKNRDIVYTIYGPETNSNKLTKLAEKIIRGKPDLIFVSSTPATMAVDKASKGTGIPIVFAPVNDPVKAGIVQNLKQPGKNITGIKLAVVDGHRLALLKKIAPKTSKVFFPYNPKDQSSLTTLENVVAIEKQLGLNIHKAEITSIDQIPEALAAMPNDIDAIYLPRDSLIESQIQVFNAIAVKRLLPLSAPSSMQVEAGALFSYGHNHYQLGKQASRLAAQILKGISPGSIPVESAQCFFEINMRTAKEISLRISDKILRQADTLTR